MGPWPYSRSHQNRLGCWVGLPLYTDTITEVLHTAACGRMGACRDHRTQKSKKHG